MSPTILCCTDNNYAPNCGVMLTSLFKNNKDCCFEVFVIANRDISESNVNKFHELGQRFKNRISLITVDDSAVKNLPLKASHITLPTYFRFWAAELLPQSVDKVIYLDSDLLVVGDICPLWEVDLTGKALAGIANSSEESTERLGYPSEYRYFNAGVLTINLKYWRENHVGQQLLDYSLKHGSNLDLMDQDVLNCVLHDQKVILPPRYNFQIYYFKASRWNDYSEQFREDLVSECKDVRIVHYVGPKKPWCFQSYGGPFFSIWEKHRRESLWRMDFVSRSCIKYVKHILKRRYFLGMFGRQHPEWAFHPKISKYYR